MRSKLKMVRNELRSEIKIRADAIAKLMFLQSIFSRSHDHNSMSTKKYRTSFYIGRIRINFGRLRVKFQWCFFDQKSYTFLCEKRKFNSRRYTHVKLFFWRHSWNKKKKEENTFQFKNNHRFFEKLKCANHRKQIKYHFVNRF